MIDWGITMMMMMSGDYDDMGTRMDHDFLSLKLHQERDQSYLLATAYSMIYTV